MKNKKNHWSNARMICAPKEVLAIIAIAIICSSTATAALDITYDVIDLGTLGGVSSYAYAVNNSNVVTGVSNGTTFMWSDLNDNNETDPGEMIDLGGVSPGSSSRGHGINDDGHVVGLAYIDASNSQPNAFLWNGATMASIGTIDSGAASYSWAFDINSSDQITGVSDDNGDAHAFIYDSGTMTSLGVLGTGNNSWGYGINDSGWAVGRSEVNDSIFDPEEHAFLYNGIDPIIDLGEAGINSKALAISNSGTVIGSNAYDSSFNGEAVKWTYNSTTGGYDMTNLETILGVSKSEALGINLTDEIVGNIVVENNQQHAFIYVDGVMYDLNENDLLNTPGWTLRTATGINDEGWIVGEGTIDGEYHAFLLMPVPEPATMMLIALGGLIIRKRC